MISKNDDLDDSSHEDDLDDFNDEKISTLSALVEKTKKLVEAEETKNEKWDRLDKTKVIYEEASAEIDQLSEKLDSPSLTSEEEIAIGDKLKTVELTSLEKEYEILKQCLEVVQSRLRERKSDARLSLDQSLKDTLNDYLMSLDEPCFSRLTKVLGGDKSDTSNYRDLMLDIFEEFAEKERLKEVTEDLGILKPFANSAIHWNGFNELFIKPFAMVHKDSKSFHHFISAGIEKAKRERSSEKSNRRTGWIVIGLIVILIIYFTSK
jgi:hypothetical protein